jgi:hypothetical protein
MTTSHHPEAVSNTGVIPSYGQLRRINNTDLIARAAEKEEDMVDSGAEESEDTRAQSMIKAARKVDPSEATRLRRERYNAKKNKYKVRT